MVLEYNAMESGLSIAPLSLSMFAIALLAGRRAGTRRASVVIRAGFGLLLVGVLAIIPLVPRVDSGLWLTIPLIVAGAGLGLLVSQLNNYTLAPISEERISEAAGVNSAGGTFGLSFGLAFAGGIMLATLSFTFINLTEQSTVIPPEDKDRVYEVLETDAQLLSNSELEALLVTVPQPVADEVVRINTEARPFALQTALLVPLAAAILGLIVAQVMTRQPDVKPTADLEGVGFG
jgi:hypothetical protein